MGLKIDPGDEICATCVHWYKELNVKGQCRRYAPRPTVGTGTPVRAFWPNVPGDGWCGEWVCVPTLT